jgi:hypothetical protein
MRKNLYKEHHSMIPYIITILGFAFFFSAFISTLIIISAFVKDYALFLIYIMIVIFSIGGGLLFRIILDHLHLSLTQEEIGTAIVSGLAGIFTGILQIYLNNQTFTEAIIQKSRLIIILTNEYVISTSIITLFYIAPIMISKIKKENWVKFCIYYICTIPVGFIIIYIASFFL